MVNASQRFQIQEVEVFEGVKIFGAGDGHIYFFIFCIFTKLGRMGHLVILLHFLGLDTESEP